MSEPASSHPSMPPSLARPSLRESTQTFLATSSPEQMPPLSDDQPTVITNRPPLQPAPGIVASAAVRPATTTSGGLEPGSLLDHFQLVEYIGGGGMGRVYRALDTGLGRQVALKVLTREQAQDPDTVTRFLNEARSVARLNHESIAQVYYVGETAGMPFIAFEFVEGIDIRALVEQEGPLPLPEAISYTLQIAEALAHAAQRRLVHRDVKPSNVLITREGKAKLIDFGLARLRDPDDSGTGLTASGVTLGTFDYISPEQARDPRNADQRSDTYSLGCTFFYMLAGRPPFPEGTVLQKLLRHQGDEPPDIREFRPDVPEEVARVLRKMMAKDPRRRYQDSEHLIEALLILADLVGLRPLGPGRRIWTTPQEPAMTFARRHAPWFVPVAALIGITMLLNAVWSSSGPSPEDFPPRRMMREMAGRMVGQTAAVGQEIPGGAVAATSAISLAGRSDRVASLPPERTRPSTENQSLRESLAAEPNAGLGQAGPPKPLAAGASADTSLADSGTRTGPGTLVPLSAGRPELENHLADPLDQKPPLREAAADSPLAPSSFPAAGQLAAIGQTLPGAGMPVAGNTPLSGPRVLVVDPGSVGENGFATLAAACAAAKSGDTIELRFDGRQDERPLTLADLRLTIRAAEGCRPVVVFRPGGMDPTKQPHSMLSLRGSELTVSGVAMEVNSTADFSLAEWCFMELHAADTVRLEQCSLTIRNASEQQTAYQPGVAFFRIRNAPAAGVPRPSASAKPPARARVELTDCIARGEATFLRAEGATAWDLIWKNGLLATTESMLSVQDADQGPADVTNQVRLEHLTAVTRGGFCRFSGSRAGSYQPSTYLQASSSVFMASGAPLIERIGALGLSQAVDPIVWQGDRNLYEGFSFFRVVRDFDSTSPVEQIPFGAWFSPWEAEPEELPSLDQVRWQRLPDPSRPVHAHTPADYLIDEASLPSSAVHAADAEQHPGLVAGHLPPLPLEPVAYAPSTGPAWR